MKAGPRGHGQDLRFIPSVGVVAWFHIGKWHGSDVRKLFSILWRTD
jgi:hypothetical protein